MCKKKKTWKQALEESIEHHKDNLKRLEVDEGRFMNEASSHRFVIDKTAIYYDDEHCSLCRKADREDLCPLYKFEGEKCCGDGGTAWDAIRDAKTRKEAMRAEKLMIKNLIEARIQEF